MSDKSPIKSTSPRDRWSVRMGKLIEKGVWLWNLAVIAAAVILTTASLVRDKNNNLRAAIYVFAPGMKFGGDLKEYTAGFRKTEDPSPSNILEDDKWLRTIRNDAALSARKQEKDCGIIASIQGIDNDCVDTYYHLPQAVIQFLDLIAMTDHRSCHHRCPVRLRLLEGDPDRLWPRRLVVAECVCENMPCSSGVLSQCRQAFAPVWIICRLSGERPKYCKRNVPAGCQCISIFTSLASSFETFETVEPPSYKLIERQPSL